jgi:hypothetical protein
MKGPGFHWFGRQCEAVEACETAGTAHGVFVSQRFDGTRRFLVASYDDFAQSYMTQVAERCHFFEVICVNRPCRLYFDVDVALDEPRTVATSLLTFIIVDYVCHCLSVIFQLSCCRSDVLVLDSSTPTKFSQHLIFPNVVFKTNTQCGGFVKQIISQARERLTAASSNTVWSGNGGDDVTRGFPLDSLDFLFVEGVSVVDCTVYSRNRHFRLWRSSKVEKDLQYRPLRVAEENTFAYTTDRQLLDASVVLVVGDVDAGTRVLQFDVTQSTPPVRAAGAAGGGGQSVARQRTVRSTNSSLDEFVLGYIHTIPQMREVTITSVTEFADGRSVNYYVDGGRWCRGVGREHSRNRPYFCANLHARVIYQMCHSTKCRTINGPYRSASTPIPAAVLDNIGNYLEGDEVDQIMAVMPLPE